MLIHCESNVKSFDPSCSPTCLCLDASIGDNRRNQTRLLTGGGWGKIFVPAGSGVPSPHRHLEGWEASHGGPVLKGGGTADRTRCQRTELERDDFISGIAQSVKTATVDVVVSALPNATGNRRENMLPLRVQFRSWELDRVSPLFQRFLPKSLEGNCNY